MGSRKPCNLAYTEDWSMDRSSEIGGAHGPDRQIVVGIQQVALLNRAATLADVGNVAAFVTSDQARTMTATEVNISCGAIID
jgi:enoyl-[acyl-carrier-protein] reductase (NADH)